MITRTQKLDCIDRITNSYDPRLRLFSREARRDKARFLVDLVADLKNDNPQLSNQELRGRALAAYDAKYGNPLLIFLAFNLIWWFIERYLLD